MNRAAQSLVACAAAFAAGWFAAPWLRPAREKVPTVSPPTESSPIAPPRAGMDGFLQAGGAAARLRVLADWKALPLAEIKSLWADRNRLPAAWQRPVTRQLLLAWLQADAAGACEALIPKAAPAELKETMANRHVAYAINEEERKYPLLVADLAREWLRTHPDQPSALAGALWFYDSDDDGGWDNMAAAKELSKLVPESLLEQAAARGLLDESAGIALEVIAKTDPAKALRLAAHHDLSPDGALRGWAQTDPLAALRATQQHRGERRWERCGHTVLETWWERTPAAAREFITAGLKDGSLPEDLRCFGVEAVSDSLLKEGPERALEWLKSQPASVPPPHAAYVRIIEAIAASDPDRALLLLQQSPASGADEGQRALSSVLSKVIHSKLAAKDAESVRSWSLTQPEALRTELLYELHSQSLAGDPAFVLRHATEAETPNKSMLGAALRKLAEQPEAAVVAWQAMPENLRRQHTATLSDSLAAAGHAEQAMKLAALTIQQGNAWHLRWLNDLRHGANWSESRIPAGAPLMDWLCALPDDKAKPDWTRGGLTRWLDADARAALAWHDRAAAQQPAPVRQALHAAVVIHLADTDPAAAAAWTFAHIADKAERIAALQVPFRQLAPLDPTLTRTALTSAGLSPREQEDFFVKPVKE